MDNGRKIIITILAIAILAAGGFFAWKKYYNPKPIPVSPAAEQKKEEAKKEEPATLGEQIYEQTQNPAEKIPETNPYEAAKNPFEETKTNPYSDGYVNPFE